MFYVHNYILTQQATKAITCKFLHKQIIFYQCGISIESYSPYFRGIDMNEQHDVVYHLQGMNTDVG